MSKELKRPYIDFCGFSSSDVTGSCYHIKYKDYSIVLDCGLVQTNNLLQDYKLNHEKIKGLRPKDIDAILISHGNIDHHGRLPWLYAQGCTAPTYVVKGTKSIIKILLEDSLRIMESDVEKLLNKHGIKAKTLYSQEDINTTIDNIVEVDYDETIKFNSNISFRFIPAHHILHSAQIHLILQDNMCLKRIGYTGDIGSKRIYRPYLKESESLPFCDIVIGECTYSAPQRNHKPKDRDKDVEKIISVIQDAVENNSRVLIPVFAYDRLESILTILYEIYKDNCPLPILVDTPLGKKIASKWGENLEVGNDKWDNVCNWNNVTWLNEYSESKARQEEDNPYIILSSSGMCTAGRSLGWLKQMLPNPNNRIMFCGFSSDGTLASDIKSGEKKYLKIDGDNIKNNASVVTLNSFSSHMSHDELIEYYTELPYNKLYLVHSNQNDKIEFSKELKQSLSKANRSSRVYATNSDTKIYF